MAAAGASVAVALGGDRTPVAPRTTAAGPVAHIEALPMPAKCASWGCAKAGTMDLGAGYAVTLWHAGQDGDFRAKPVVEVTHEDVAVQW